MLLLLEKHRFIQGGESVAEVNAEATHLSEHLERERWVEILQSKES